MICTVEWKGPFCALKIIQNWLYMGTLKYFFPKNLWSAYKIFFFASGTNDRCMDNSIFFILLYSALKAL